MCVYSLYVAYNKSCVTGYHWSQLRLPSVEENVPANSSAEQELVASPYGQLLTEPGQRNGGRMEMGRNQCENIWEYCITYLFCNVVMYKLIFNFTPQNSSLQDAWEAFGLVEWFWWKSDKSGVPTTLQWLQVAKELACAPGCLLAYLAKLLELALVLANSVGWVWWDGLSWLWYVTFFRFRCQSVLRWDFCFQKRYLFRIANWFNLATQLVKAFPPKTGVPLRGKAMSQTVDTILFTLRVAARVESSAVYLLQHADGCLGNGREGQRDHPKSLEMVSWVVDASLVSISISYLWYWKISWNIMMSDLLTIYIHLLWQVGPPLLVRKVRKAACHRSSTGCLTIQCCLAGRVACWSAAAACDLHGSWGGTARDTTI